MAKSTAVIVLAFFLGCAFAQFNFMDLVPGATPTTGTLLPVLTSDAAEWPQNFYRLWVPENVQSLTLTFSQTDAVCTGDIRYYIHADHVPCGSKWYENSGENFPCREATSDYFTDITSETETLFPGSTTNSVLLTPGNWVYISMVRDSSSDYAGTCTYTITTTLTTCANPGEIALNEGSSAATCKGHTDITLPHVANWNTQMTEAYYRVWVPERTANIMVYLNNSDYSTYFRGNPKYAGGDYYYECSDSSSSNGNGIYELNAVCYNPPAGWFYIYFYAYSSGYYLMGNLSITATTCNPDQAGYNCTYQAWNLTGQPALNAAQYGIVANEGASSGFPDAFKMWYVSAPNGTLATYNFTVTLTVGTSAYVYYRRGGYIADDSDNYLFYEGLSLNTAEIIALTAGDFWVGGSHFFGVSNEGSATVNFTLSSAAASVSTSTGVTGGATTDATTGSGAATIFASFALIAALIAALF